MEFRILGPLQVFDDARPLALGGPKQRAVLAHLILRANHTVGAEQLVDGLWGEEPPETARNTLQTYVYRLRKVLGEERLEGRDGGYVLTAAPDELDAARFEAIVKDAKRLSASDPAAAATRFGDALALWRGAPLHDLGEEASLRGEIARLEELHLSATEHRIAAEIASGRNSTVVSELEALTARYPLRERMWANLMLALYRSGRQAEALSTYQRAREMLSDELGTEPSTELQRLHERILQRDPSLGRTEPPRQAVRPSRVDLPPGTEFAGYRIERTLGRGGMAVVYLAEHDFLQRKVALKVLAPQLAEDDRFRERFIRESRLAASLDHPNVVPIYEAGASGGDLFIAMRYVEGTDLRTLLAESGSLDPARAVSVTRQVAAALDSAHEQGLVHRDVKPGNVLVARTRGSEAGEHVYLSDFGLTKRSTSESGVTGTGQFVGTLDYAAPEQFQGGTPDARTDVYSLGCVLFECLTGHPPFRAENDASLMYAHLQEQPPSVMADRPDLPKEIDGVIAKALAKAPAGRQPSAGALGAEAAEALRVGAGGEPDGSGASRGRMQMVAAVLAVGVALVAGIVLSALVRNDAPEAAGAAGQTSPHPSPTPTAPPTFRTVDRALTEPEEELLTFIPDGVADECLPLDRPEPIHGERASLVCRPDGMEVLYQLFQTRDEMNEAFQVNVNNKSAADGDCATDTLAVSPYTIGGETAGRVLCYTIDRGPFFDGGGFSESLPDQSHIEWTDDNASIYAHAIRNDLGDLSLYDWWRTSSGPVLAGDEGTTVAVKERPHVASVPPPQDGTYLATTGSCRTSRIGTCIMHLDAPAYDIRNFNEIGPFDAGAFLLRKPDSIVIAPRVGYCYERARSPDPVTFTWTASGGKLSFERTDGGHCGGPGFTGPWTRAPAGMIAVEQGSEIELIEPGGSVVQSPMQPETTPNSWPDWSPDGSKIVFSGADQQGFDLYVMNADGTDVTRLTNTPGDETTPAWSPDGASIAFAFDDGGEAHYHSSIAVIRADGTGWTEIVGADDRSLDSPAWSPDGSQIAYTMFTNSATEPYVVDARGGESVKLLDGQGFVQSWTPDGDRIMIAAFDSIVTVRPDGTYGGAFMKYPPERGLLVLDWSPDGRWIAASSPTTAGHTLYLIRGDGSEVYQIGSGTDPSWRPAAT